MKVLMDLVAEYYPISGNGEVDSYLYIFIGFIALVVAFDLVGIIFDSMRVYDSKLMSDVHWFLRFMIFFGLAWILRKLFIFINWLFSFQWWVYILLMIGLISSICLIHYLKHKVTRNKYKMEEVDEADFESISEESIENEIIDEVKTIRDYCPRCGKSLIERKGPYGYFWGCEGFRGKKDSRSCKYTRAFK